MLASRGEVASRAFAGEFAESKGNCLMRIRPAHVGFVRAIAYSPSTMQPVDPGRPHLPVSFAVCA